MCNSADETTSTAAIHRLSAVGTQSQLVFGQEKIAQKSNEIKAIPALLNALDLKGHTVTIDAMGYQRAIAKAIKEKGADYVLALKGYQATLNKDIRLFFGHELKKTTQSAIDDSWTEADKGHGRIESRTCCVSSQTDWLIQKPEWTGLNSIIMVESTREIQNKMTKEQRFFISSLPADAKSLAHAVRSHWAIENTPHWTLDVVFNENQSRVRKDHAPENRAVVRHVTLNRLKNAKPNFRKDTSIKQNF